LALLRAVGPREVVMAAKDLTQVWRPGEPLEGALDLAACSARKAAMAAWCSGEARHACMAGTKGLQALSNVGMERPAQDQREAGIKAKSGKGGKDTASRPEARAVS